MGGKPTGAQRLLEGVAAPRFRPYERRETFQPTSQALRLQPASHIRRGLTLTEPSKPRTWRLHLLVLGVNGVNEVDGARHVSAHQAVSFRLLCLNCCGSKSAMTNPYPTFTSADQVSSANTGACSMMRCIMRWCAFVASFPATSLHALPTTSFNDYSSCAAGSSSGAAGEPWHGFPCFARRTCSRAPSAQRPCCTESTPSAAAVANAVCFVHVRAHARVCSTLASQRKRKYTQQVHTHTHTYTHARAHTGETSMHAHTRTCVRMHAISMMHAHIIACTHHTSEPGPRHGQPPRAQHRRTQCKVGPQILSWCCGCCCREHPRGEVWPRLGQACGPGPGVRA